MKIEFVPMTEDTHIVVPPPKPARAYLPTWYLETEKFTGGAPVYQNGHVSNMSVKACVPFMDAMTHGYIQESWCDMHVSLKQGVEYHYAFSPQPIAHRERASLSGTPGMHSTEFTWLLPWHPRVPVGWSVLMTHPLNRLDLPFRTLSGLIDADAFTSTSPASFPFYILSDSDEVFIPAGTPLYQIIPVRRESWTSSTVPFDAEKDLSRRAEVHRYFHGGYRRFFHSRKSFT